MNTPLTNQTGANPPQPQPVTTLLTLPVQPPLQANAAAVGRLVAQCGASWVDEHTLDAWAAAGGDRVLLLAGDAVQFPEGQDVAAVLPELQRSSGGRFAIGVVPRAQEDKLARRFGSQRWPALLFLRDGHYVTTINGMHDWLVFVDKVAQALALPTSRAPGIGIPLVSAGPPGPSCH